MSPEGRNGVLARIGKSGLWWALNKLLKGGGPGADPTEIDPGVPSGIIAQWHRPIADIPAGWVACDGNNETPNFLGKFLEMVPNLATDPGATGGSTAKTTAGHEHDVGIGGGGVQSNTAHITTETDSIADIRPLYYDVAFIMKT